MGERRLCKPEVTGSSPVFSTKWIDQKWMVSPRLQRSPAALTMHCWWIRPPDKGTGGRQSAL